jgi:hypothetical protein
VGALSTPGTAVLSPAGCRARPSPAASQRPVPAPRCRTHQRGSDLRGINEGSRDSPVRPAPHLWPPGWDGRPLGFPLCSAPRRYRQRTTGRGRALSTRPELHDRQNRPSNPRVHSQGATSCRNGMTGCSSGVGRDSELLIRGFGVQVPGGAPGTDLGFRTLTLIVSISAWNDSWNHPLTCS